MVYTLRFLLLCSLLTLPNISWAVSKCVSFPAGTPISCAVTNTLTDTKVCTYDAASGKINCDTTPGAASAAGGLNAVQYNNPVGTLAGTENVFSFNGTNVGIGTSNGIQLLDVRGAAIIQGNVGIGTLSPATAPLAMLHVVNPTTGNTLIVDDRDGGDPSPAIFVNAAGNVGFGTTNPVSSPFQVFNQTGVNPHLEIRNGTSSGTNIGIGTTAVQPGAYFNNDGQNNNTYRFWVANEGASGSINARWWNRTTGSGITLNIPLPAGASGITNVPAGTPTLSGADNGTLGFAVGAGVGNLFLFTGTTAGIFMQSSDNNVGIGTITPIVKLQVTGNIGIGTTYTNTGSLIGAVGNNSAALLTLMKNTDFVSSPAAFYVGSDGKVGIGTSAPAAAVTVTTGNVSATAGGFVATSGFTDNGSGDVTLNGAAAKAIVGSGGFCTNNDTAHFCLKPAGATESDANFQINSATKMHMDSNGNVGIGTTSTRQKFSVIGNIGIGTVKDGDLFISTAPPNGGMIIEKNVGIGTVNPGTILDVTGTTRQTGFTLTGNGAAAGFMLQSSSSVGIGTWVPAPAGGGSGTINSGTVSRAAYYSAATTLDSSTKIFNDNTNVGIGTFTPRTTVEIGVQTMNISGSNVGIGTINPQSTLSIGGGNGLAIGSAYSTLTAGSGNQIVQGNIGIGSVNPGVALDVNGTERFSNSGDSYFGGNVGIGTSIVMNSLAVQGAVAVGSVGFVGVANPDIIGFMTDGNVGIGTNKTTSGAALTVMNGNVGIGTWRPPQTMTIFGNIGIGTIVSNANLALFSPASPGGQMYVQGNVGLGTFRPGAPLTVKDYIQTTIGTTPVIGTCGTSPAIGAGSTDSSGFMTIGTGGITVSCAVTFGHTWTRAPSCVCNHQGAILYTRGVATTTALTCDAATPITASGRMDYVCFGND